MSKIGYSTYVKERLSGFDGEAAALSLANLDDYPGLAETALDGLVTGMPACTGPVKYIGHDELQTDLTNLNDARVCRGRTRDCALKQCTNMRTIHARPASVEKRRNIGHWEGDLIVGAGQRSAIATLVERKTRLAILVRLPYGHSAPAVRDALITMFNRLPAGLRKTLTWDQGNEMFHHERIAESTGMTVYSPTRTRPGNAEATRISTAYCASTCPAERTSGHGQATSSTGSPPRSTTDHATAWVTAARPSSCNNGNVNEQQHDSQRSLETAKVG